MMPLLAESWLLCVIGGSHLSPQDLTLVTIQNNKTSLIVKEACYNEAVSLFKGTGVSITVEGKQHLGAALGSPPFVESFVHQSLSVAAETKCFIRFLRNSYAAFFHGVVGKWNSFG